MNTDDILDYRRLLTQFDLPTPDVPEPIVYATDEWVDAIWKMTQQIPIVDDGLTWPTFKETGWPWGDTGVLVIFETPPTLEHIILTDGPEYTIIEPVIDRQECEAILFTREAPHQVRQVDSSMQWHTLNIEPQYATTAIYLSPISTREDGLKFIPLSTASLVQNRGVKANEHMGIAQSTRFSYSLTWAMGHRMTTHTPMSFHSRPAMKRWARSKLPEVRMLELTAPTADDLDGERPVNWTKSWKVRTHWRNQACGPKLRQHKRILIHEYWKQPDLPPDLRPTVWRTET